MRPLNLHVHRFIMVSLFYTACVFYTVRVWYIPYAYGIYHTRMVRSSVPYAYGISHTRMVIPYAYRNVRVCIVYSYNIIVDIRVATCIYIASYSMQLLMHAYHSNIADNIYTRMHACTNHIYAQTFLPDFVDDDVHEY